MKKYDHIFRNSEGFGDCFTYSMKIQRPNDKAPAKRDLQEDADGPKLTSYSRLVCLNNRKFLCHS